MTWLELNTPHFQFNAFGHDENHARHVLKRGVIRHFEQYGAPTTINSAEEMLVRYHDDIRVVDNVTPGTAYRDHEKLKES